VDDDLVHLGVSGRGDLGGQERLGDHQQRIVGDVYDAG